VTTWELVRFLHLAAVAFFVGGQLMLVAVVTPAVRRHGTEATMRAVARRFGTGTLIALAVLVASGAAMASHFGRWHDPTLQAKLGVLVLVGVLIALHIASPETRGISLAMLAASLLIVWLGVKLVYG
jgi:putative copper export protein